MDLHASEPANNVEPENQGERRWILAAHISTGVDCVAGKSVQKLLLQHGFFGPRPGCRDTTGCSRMPASNYCAGTLPSSRESSWHRSNSDGSGPGRSLTNVINELECTQLRRKLSMVVADELQIWMFAIRYERRYCTSPPNGPRPARHNASACPDIEPVTEFMPSP